MRWLAVLLLAPCFALANVGTITEQAGPAAEIQRQRSALEANKGTGVQMNDAIKTNKTRLGITFEDNTKVQLTEQSRLVIDDFVYDPKQGTGRVAMNVAMGTVRMASGNTAKNSRENVRITTPTATISVRGTDFTMTVDEVGRSLIILLPTCPENAKDEAECWTGAIEVSTDAGYVLLNQAYQATMVSSANSMPSDPKIVGVDESMIDNMLIVSPPRALFSEMNRTNEADSDNGLSQDFLEYKELSKNFLEEDLLNNSEFSIDRLRSDFLENMLDRRSELDEDEFAIDPVLPTVRRYPWVQWAYNEENIYLYKERPPHIAVVSTAREAQGMVNITQDGVAANIQLNDGGTNVVINITQNQ
jgi:hypothetical protein